jgi:hypothetical protein
LALTRDCKSPALIPPATAKDKAKQIPFGDDNKKGKSKGKARARQEQMCRTLGLAEPGVVNRGATRPGITADNQDLAVREPCRGGKIIGVEAASHYSVKRVGGGIVDF